MFQTNDPREQEYLAAIRSAERHRTAFPFVFLFIAILISWRAGHEVFAAPTLETAWPIIIALGIVYIGTEILNLKVLMYKAEYRDWLREFRTDTWQSINDE